jgi:uncharacterized LabA/DUF88 family protein
VKLVDRTVLLIDAGNLLAAAGNLTVGSHKRHDFTVRIDELHQALVALVVERSQLPLLRTYWYDAIIFDKLKEDYRLTKEHQALRECPYIKLRLGRLVGGEQKGVDALIYRDLTTLARQHSVVSAYLLAGDEDLREGVREAQDLGIQVTLLAVEGSQNSAVAETLIWEADEVVDLDADFFRPYFFRRDGNGAQEAAVALADSSAGG